MEVNITSWALDSYMNLKGEKGFDCGENMTTFVTTPEQKMSLFKIAVEMGKAGLSPTFVAAAVDLAEQFEGAFELMMLWSEEADENERDEVIADLQEEIDFQQEAHQRVYNATKINFDELDLNIENVKEFKKALRQIVDEWGGISKLAEASGIPQPSLSRFFSSGSLPRNTTIYRIIEALRPKGAMRTTWRPPYTIQQILAEVTGVSNTNGKPHQ